MNSLQWEQKVGCLKNFKTNRCSLTSKTFFFFRAPFLIRTRCPIGWLVELWHVGLILLPDMMEEVVDFWSESFSLLSFLCVLLLLVIVVAVGVGEVPFDWLDGMLLCWWEWWSPPDSLEVQESETTEDLSFSSPIVVLRVMAVDPRLLSLINDGDDDGYIMLVPCLGIKNLLQRRVKFGKNMKSEPDNNKTG